MSNISFPIIVISLFLLNFILCQDVDQDMLKAVACISLIRKMDKKITDQNILSGYMVTCFSRIDDSVLNNLVSNQMLNDLHISEDQIKKLTDFDSFTREHTSEEMVDYSKRLNSALEKLKNTNLRPEDLRAGQSGKKKGSNKQSDSEGGFIPFLFNGLKGLLNPNDSFLVLIGFFVLAYFCLKGLRKILSNKKINTTNKKKGKKD